jgi:hypothetical protein
MDVPVSNLHVYPGSVIRIPYRKSLFPLYIEGEAVAEGCYYSEVLFDKIIWMNWKYTKIAASPSIPLAVNGWKCRTCGTTFFGTDFEDLYHECTKDRDEYFYR